MIHNDKPVPPKQTRIGAAATRSAQALKDFKQAELDRRKAVKQKREELEDAAAAAAVQLRRVERERRRDQEYYFISELGQAAMAALRRQGMTGSLVSAEEVLQWPKIDLERLRYHLQQPEEPQVWRNPDLDYQVVYMPGGPPGPGCFSVALSLSHFPLTRLTIVHTFYVWMSIGTRGKPKQTFMRIKFHSPRRRLFSRTTSPSPEKTRFIWRTTLCCSGYERDWCLTRCGVHTP